MDCPRVCTTRPPRPRPCSAPPAREGPRRSWQRRPACIRARGGSAPPCCTGTRPACAAGPARACAASRPRRRPPPGARPSGSRQRPQQPRGRRGGAPDQVSARRLTRGRHLDTARNEWEPGRRAAGQAGKRALLSPFLFLCLRFAARLLERCSDSR